jgi:hypothetical protein
MGYSPEAASSRPRGTWLARTRQWLLTLRCGNLFKGHRAPKTISKLHHAVHGLDQCSDQHHARHHGGRHVLGMAVDDLCSERLCSVQRKWDVEGPKRDNSHVN